MRIFGYTIIKTAVLEDLREYNATLKCQLVEAKRNNYRGKDGRFVKAPSKKKKCKEQKNG